MSCPKCLTFPPFVTATFAVSDKIPICPVSETAILWTKTPGMLRARSAIIFKLEVGQFQLSLPVEVNNEKN